MKTLTPISLKLITLTLLIHIIIPISCDSNDQLLPNAKLTNAHRSITSSSTENIAVPANTPSNGFAGPTGPAGRAGSLVLNTNVTFDNVGAAVSYGPTVISYNSGTKTYTINSYLIITGNLTIQDTVTVTINGSIILYGSLHIAGTTGTLHAIGDMYCNGQNANNSVYINGPLSAIGTITFYNYNTSSGNLGCAILLQATGTITSNILNFLNNTTSDANGGAVLNAGTMQANNILFSQNSNTGTFGIGVYNAGSDATITGDIVEFYLNSGVLYGTYNNDGIIKADMFKVTTDCTSSTLGKFNSTVGATITSKTGTGIGGNPYMVMINQIGGDCAGGNIGLPIQGTYF